MQLDILLLWIVCSDALLYQWRIHAVGYFVIMDSMPSYISGGYMQLDILLLWILCLLISVEDTCSGIFTRNLNSISADMHVCVFVCV